MAWVSARSLVPGLTFVDDGRAAPSPKPLLDAREAVMTAWRVALVCFALSSAALEGDDGTRCLTLPLPIVSCLTCGCLWL